MTLNGAYGAVSYLLLMAPCQESAAKWQAELDTRVSRFVIATYQPDQSRIPTIPFTVALVDTTGSTPAQHALNVCRQLRKQTPNPILLLSPKQDETHVLCAYQIGVDDCIRKPIGTDLLMAKIKAWHRFAHHPLPSPSMHPYTPFNRLRQN